MSSYSRYSNTFLASINRISQRYIHTVKGFKGNVNYKGGKPLSLAKIVYLDLLNERFNFVV